MKKDNTGAELVGKMLGILILAAIIGSFFGILVMTYKFFAGAC